MALAAVPDVIKSQPGLLGDASRPGLQALPRLVSEAEAAVQAGHLQLAKACLDTYFAEASRCVCLPSHVTKHNQPPTGMAGSTPNALRVMTAELQHMRSSAAEPPLPSGVLPQAFWCVSQGSTSGPVRLQGPLCKGTAGCQTQQQLQGPAAGGYRA